MKIYLTLCVSLVLLCSSFRSDDKVIYSFEGVEISYWKAECKLDNSFDQDWFLLKIKNSNPEKIKLTYNVNLFNKNGDCVNCSSVENIRTIELAAGQTLEGFCDFKCPAALRIVSKLNDVSTNDYYASFKLENITISK